VDRVAAEGADLVVLPETWAGPARRPEVARRGNDRPRRRPWPPDTKPYSSAQWIGPTAKRRLNAAVVLDRDGQVIAVYDKVYPYCRNSRSTRR